MNQALSAYHKKQMEEKRIDRERRLIQEMEEADQINKFMENDEKMFRTYAEKCLNEWAANVIFKY